MNKPVTIGCYVGGSDYQMFLKVWNQGIDAHLEAFTKSKHKYYDNGRRLQLIIDISELPLLVRRLEELGTLEADGWASDIRELEEYPHAP